MEDSEADEAAIRKWELVLGQCYLRRLQAPQVASALDELWKLRRIPGLSLAKIALKAGAQYTSGNDPLTTGLVAHLVAVEMIAPHQLLEASLKLSQFSAATQQIGDTLNVSSYSNSTLESNLVMLATRYLSTDRTVSNVEATSTLSALGNWIDAVNTYETMLSVQTDALQNRDPALVTIFEALGNLLVTFLSNDKIKSTLKQRVSTENKSRFVLSLSHFANALSHWSQHSQLAPRLQLISRSPPFAQLNDKGVPDFTLEEISGFVVNLPPITSRAGLYVYLNAMLCARPCIDDTAILNHLNARYQSDSQSMLIDLIIASFDALANALQRHEPKTRITMYRSFIANKLPLLLTYLASGLYPSSTADYCVQLALSRLDVHPFPPLSLDSEGFNDILRSSRKEFVSACQLHQLLSDGAAAATLAFAAATPTSRTARYAKETLVSQCTNNMRRVEELFSDVETMSGNAGAVCLALVEVLQNLCQTKDTMSLRTYCNVLSRQIGVADLMLQYVSLDTLLSPLCNVLNEWTHDQDQTEFQPAYEEFASILLLLQALIHRYAVSLQELHAVGSDSFVIKLQSRLSRSSSVTELTEEDSTHLSVWIQGLYAVDEQGESTGFSDETMSHCPPQAFYLLVPTLLEQSIVACKAGRLAIETLKGGLEFLLEPFLLPALVPGLHWLVKHIWEDHGDVEIVIQVLDKLLCPASISGDAKSMHETIKAMVAAPLEQQLGVLDRRMPDRKDIAALLEAMRPYTMTGVQTQSCSTCSSDELNDWMSRSDDGIKGAIKETLNRLITWSSQSELVPVPAAYSHRMILLAMQVQTADQIVMTIAREIAQQTATGTGSAALEVATAIICAPCAADTPQSRGERRDLKQALRLWLSDVQSLLNLPNEVAEALIRLGRLVDAQSVVTQVAQMPVQLPLGNIESLTNIGTDELMQEMQDAVGTSELGNMDAANALRIDLPASLHVFENGVDQDMTFDLDPVPASLEQNQGPGQDKNGPTISSSDPIANQSQQSSTLLMNEDENAGNTIDSSSNNNNNNNTMNDDDIFAGLDLGDMGDMGDDDFGF